MKNKILLCASIAYDYLMSFDGNFKDTINIKTLDALSVSFLANSREKFYGGCAANIGYNLGLLGKEPLLLSAVGDDFAEYDESLKKCGVDTQYVARINGELTASAYILSDAGESQIAIFSPGASANTNYAMNFNGIPVDELAYVLIGPENPVRVMSLVKQCIEMDLSYIFDPGQIAHVLSADDLNLAISKCFVLIANEFETSVLEEKLNKKAEAFCSDSQIFISTLGEKGCNLYEGSKLNFFKAIEAENAVDPTGCGDAFRAGLLTGLIESRSLEESIKMALLMGTLAVQEKGTQNHHFNREDFDRYFAHIFA